MTALTRQITRRALLVLCITAWSAAAVASHLPPQGVPQFHVSDKAVHFAGYFVLAGILLLTLRAYGLAPRRRLIIATVVLLLYGVLDEATQPMFRRSASIADWLADAAGVISAACLDALVAKFIRR